MILPAQRHKPLLSPQSKPSIPDHSSTCTPSPARRHRQARPPQDREDADRDACDAIPTLETEVAELLEEHSVSLEARLVAREDPIEEEAEVQAEAEEVLIVTSEVASQMGRK